MRNYLLRLFCNAILKYKFNVKCNLSVLESLGLLFDFFYAKKQFAIPIRAPPSY